LTDLATLGRRIRYFRSEAGLTLAELGAEMGIAPSQLSLIENGHKEPRISLLTALSERFAVPLAQILDDAAPTKRAAMEIALEKFQLSAAYQELGLPSVRPSRGVHDATLAALVGLHSELDRRAKLAIATPEEARRANTEQRLAMRERNNYMPEIEELAERSLADVGHEGGALTHRTVSELAERLGLEIVHASDLPHFARSVLDLEGGRIYIPPASIPGGHGLRSLALQALAHRLLEHNAPVDYRDFLNQRLAASYYAAACLMPRGPSVEFLSRAKSERRIAIEDFRDTFGVTHDAAALRFSNLATEHLGIDLHYLRVTGTGFVSKAYENDGLPMPVDVTGSTEGEMVCRHWSSRQAFTRNTRTTEYHQYTDTPAGMFFESTQTGTGQGDEFSITVGVPYVDSKWFRGRDSRVRQSSQCPELHCCRNADKDLTERWRARSWASARVHTQTFAPLPHGTYPGVDDRELYEFLEAHADKGDV